MTTIEKMRTIQKLINEVEIATRQVALEIKDVDAPLYRMLTEGCADQFKVMSKNYASQVESWDKQLQYAYELFANKIK
ncbi:MAG: hypothetical protein K9I82_02145 [Chitinophagaceae bacterium]|nr:hypothetical protein [Chitinophagaceae bacterium]